MRTIYMTIGLPGSGKTFWSRELMKKEPNRWKRVNRDDIRLMNDGFLFRVGMNDREKLITKISDSMIRHAMDSGFDVILDNTHLNGRARKDIHKLAETYGNVTVIEKVFHVPLRKVFAQNALRHGDAKVPEHVIEEFAKKYGVDKSSGYFKQLKDRTTYYPSSNNLQANCGEKVVQDPSLPKAIVCDLDGTLALMNGRNPFDASNCDKDLPNTPVVNVVKLYHNAGYKILFVSGRSDEFRPQTETFLNMHTPDLAPHSLAMRRSGDTRKDSIIKREIYDEVIKGKYFVEAVIDDRNQVVEMWRNEMGFTVFQVADGNF